MKTKQLILFFFMIALSQFSQGGLSAQNLTEIATGKKLIEMNSFVLFVNRPDVSKKFYTDILKMSIKSESPDYIEFKEGLTLWKLKKATDIIFKKQVVKDDSSAMKVFELYFTTENIDSVMIQLKTAGVKMIHDLEVQPWSQKVIRFYDPDGNIVEIGEKMEVVVKQFKKQMLTDEEISEKTFLPLDVIRKILQD